MGKGIVINFSKNIISPGDIVIAEATYDGSYKKTAINNNNYGNVIKLLNLEGAETPISFSSHFGEGKFSEIRYIKVNNEIFESEKTLFMDDNIYASLQNPIFQYEVPPVFYIYKDQEKIAKVECFYDEVTTENVLFECETTDNKKVYQITFEITILKKTYVNERLLGKLESYGGADNKFAFKVTDISSIKKMWLEVK